MLDFHNFITRLHPTFNSFPASPAHLMLYITYLNNLGYSHSTIVTKISALSFFYKLHGLPDPTSHFLVTRALTSVKKTSYTQDSRLPITLTILHSMLDQLHNVSQSSYHSALFRAMLCTSFYAFLRPGEITSSDNNLQWSNLNLFHDHFELIFRKFKHYAGEPIHINIFAQLSAHCPLSILMRYIFVRGFGAGPLFCHPSGRPITYSEYNTFFARVITFLRIPGKFSPHSARIGAATHAAIMGIPEETIRRLGRWRSACCLKYIRVSSFSLTR